VVKSTVMEGEMDRFEFSMSKAGKRFFQAEQGGGVSPVLLASLAHGNDVKGSTVSCKRLGIAAAKLLCRGGVAMVTTDVVSDEALQLLRKSDVTVRFSETLPASVYTSDLGERQADDYSRDLPDAARLFEDLRLRLLGLLDYQVKPSDGALMRDRARRLCSGGGGT